MTVDRGPADSCPLGDPLMGDGFGPPLLQKGEDGFGDSFQRALETRVKRWCVFHRLLLTKDRYEVMIQYVLL
jgi:hypothetical protein